MPWMLMPDHSVQQVDQATFEQFFMEVHRDHSIVQVADTSDEWIRVSTVFLLMYPPELGFFETMCFGGPLDGVDQRYMTWDEAVEGHKRMVERVTLACIQDGTMLKGPPDAEGQSRALPYKDTPQIAETGLEEE